MEPTLQRTTWKSLGLFYAQFLPCLFSRQREKVRNECCLICITPEEPLLVIIIFIGVVSRLPLEIEKFCWLPFGGRQVCRWNRPKNRQWRIYWKVMIMCTQKRWQICQCTQQEAMEKMYFSFDIISKLSTNFAQFIAVLQPETVVGLQFLFVCFHFGVDISSLINHTKKNSQKASFSAGTVCRDLNFRQFQRNEIALGTWRRFDQKL